MKKAPLLTPGGIGLPPRALRSALPQPDIPEPGSLPQPPQKVAGQKTGKTGKEAVHGVFVGDAG